MRRRAALLLAASAAAAALEAASAQAAAPRCGANNGGCVPGTRCFEVAGRAQCEYSHACPALVAPANGFVNCPGSAPGAQATYSLRLVEGNLARSAEQRTECIVGCRAGHSAVGVTAPRFCTATGWSDTSAVRCAASQQCSASASPCQNGGTCTANVNGGYRCRCPVGWAGTNCAEADSCVAALTHRPIAGLCQNGGHCRNILGGSYGCVCRAGFAGKLPSLKHSRKNPAHCLYFRPKYVDFPRIFLAIHGRPRTGAHWTYFCNS